MKSNLLSTSTTQLLLFLCFMIRYVFSAIVIHPDKVSVSLEPLRGLCVLYNRNGNWWKYEWCHENYVRQVHVDTDGTSLSRNISLGTFDPIATLEFPMNENFNLMKNKYVSQLFSKGDACESKSRASEIRFKCCEFRALDTYIESVIESNPCNYTLTICTPYICHSPDRTKGGTMTLSKRENMANEVKEMFYHAYYNYMEHAFPNDVLRPLSCKGDSFESGKLMMLTLIDSLDTLAIFGDKEEFRKAVGHVINRVSFDVDSEVSVFEITIRVLGGLISAHLMASDATLGFFEPHEYKDELLNLSIDLADRLLVAFNTTTGIPYGTVNLKYGVPFGETTVASLAGAGSLLLEFRTLSVLTSNEAYHRAASKAVHSLFHRRSRIGLMGKHIDVESGKWTESSSGIGSNSDSFYEYLLKAYILFGDIESWEMFQEVYSSVNKYNKYGHWYVDVSMWDGGLHNVNFESLMAFWPGMQTLIGDLDPAVNTLNTYFKLWREYGFIPEVWNLKKWGPAHSGGEGYPLRPELAESTYYMYRATGDATWIEAGSEILKSLQKWSRVRCGFASISDIITREVEDVMPSFFLSETCKYLFLLFNDENFVNKGNYVFTTEAHPFPIVQHKLSLFKSKNSEYIGFNRLMSSRECPNTPFWHIFGYNSSFVVNTNPVKSYIHHDSSVFTNQGKSSIVDVGGNLGKFKISYDVNTFFVQRLADLEYILVNNLGSGSIAVLENGFQGMVKYRYFSDVASAQFTCSVIKHRKSSLNTYESNSKKLMNVNCSPANFGPTRSQAVPQLTGSLIMAYPRDACSMPVNRDYRGKIVLAYRGGCFFYQKALVVQRSGGIGLIVIENTNSQQLIVMAGAPHQVNEEEIVIPSVMITLSSGLELLEDIRDDDALSIDYAKSSTKDSPFMFGHEDTLHIIGSNNWGLQCKRVDDDQWGLAILTFKSKDVSRDDNRETTNKANFATTTTTTVTSTMVTGPMVSSSITTNTVASVRNPSDSNVYGTQKNPSTSTFSKNGNGATSSMCVPPSTPSPSSKKGYKRKDQCVKEDHDMNKDLKILLNRKDSSMFEHHERRDKDRLSYSEQEEESDVSDSDSDSRKIE